MRAGVVAGHRDAVDVVAADGVGRDRRDQGRVDATGHGDGDGPEAVLAHVVAQADGQRRVDLGRLRQRRRERRRQRRVGPELGLAHRDVLHARRRVDRVDRRGLQVEVDDEQVLPELRTPREHLAPHVDDERVAVEDQLVLTADQVDVGQRAAGLASNTMVPVVHAT